MFIVDGKWIFDPENPQKMEALFGTQILMSMLSVKDPARAAQSLIDGGKELRLLSEYDAAIEKFQQVIVGYASLSPAAPQALNYIGLCLMDLSKFDAAAQKFRQLIQTYPDARMECAEAHLNLANALKSIGKTGEARSTIQRLKSNYAEMADLIRAADGMLVDMPTERASRTEDAPAAREGQQGYPATSESMDVTLTVEGLDQVFPAMSVVYAEASPGAVVIENMADQSIEDATLQFFVNDVMDFPAERKIQRIAGKSSHREPVYPIFNSRVFELTELTYKQAAITLLSRAGGQAVQKRKTVNITFRGRNDIVWDTTAKVAGFITANDNPVRDFTRKTLQLFTDDENPFPTENFAKAVRLFDALGAMGLTYIRDPNTPFDKIYGNAATIDRVSFPRETLRLKSGDCDDLTVLYSAMLENVGVRTRLVTVPGHIFLAFEGGDAAAFAEHVQNPDLVIADNGRVWIPVEVTMIGRSFTEAWREAGKEVKKYRDQAEGVQFVDVSAAWKTYKPCALEATAWAPDPPAKAAILAILSKDDIGSRKKAEAYNRAGTVFAKQGLVDEALGNFKKSLDIFPDYSDARNNIANVYVLQGKYNEAVVEYKVSLSLNPDQSAVRFNLAIAYNAVGKFDESLKEYTAARNADPALFDEGFEEQVNNAAQSGLRSEGMMVVQKWKNSLKWMQ